MNEKLYNYIKTGKKIYAKRKRIEKHCPFYDTMQDSENISSCQTSD